MFSDSLFPLTCNFFAEGSFVLIRWPLTCSFNIVSLVRSLWLLSWFYMTFRWLFHTALHNCTFDFWDFSSCYNNFCHTKSWNSAVNRTFLLTITARIRYWGITSTPQSPIPRLSFLPHRALCQPVGPQGFMLLRPLGEVIHPLLCTQHASTLPEACTASAFTPPIRKSTLTSAQLGRLFRCIHV